MNRARVLFYCGIHNLVNFSRIRPYYDMCYGFDANPEKAVHAAKVYERDPHVRIVNAILAEKGGEEAEFVVTMDWDAASSLGSPNPEFFHMKSGLLVRQKKIKLPTVNLRDFCVSNDILEIDTVVTDLQGMDLAVLKTLSEFIEAGRIREIQCEVEPDDTPPRYLGISAAKMGEFQRLLSPQYDLLWMEPEPLSADVWEMDARWRLKGAQPLDGIEFFMINDLLVAKGGPDLTPTTHSQYMEDLVIDALLCHKVSGFYVDVGANDPGFLNNTRLFYDRGWHGVNIEPEPSLHAKLCAMRERDVNLNVGVGQEPGVMTFYRMSADTLSSFNKEEAIRKGIANGERLLSEATLPVLRLVDLLDSHAKDEAIDFLSVDAEGSDLEALKSNDWSRYRPSLVIVEVDAGGDEIIRYLEEQRYYPIFDNGTNGIFPSAEFLAGMGDTVREDLASLERRFNLRTVIPPPEGESRLIINFVYEHLPQEERHALHRRGVSILWSTYPIEGCHIYVYHNAFSYRGRMGGIDILMMLEPAVVLPREFDAAVWDRFDYVLTLFDALAERGGKFRKIRFPHYGRTRTQDKRPTEYMPKRDLLYPVASRRNAICMINGNKTSRVEGELYTKRREAAAWFHGHSDIPFDVFGNPPFDLPNYKGALAPEAKQATLAQYRYCLCFENTNDQALSAGYITEKMLDCLETRTVPIYLGASNVERYIPAACFIDFRRFASFSDLDAYLHNMSEGVYRAYVDAIDAFVGEGGLRPYSSDSLYDEVVRIAVEKEIVPAGHANQAGPWTPGLPLSLSRRQWRAVRGPAMWTWKHLSKAGSALSGLDLPAGMGDSRLSRPSRPDTGRTIKLLCAGKKYAYGDALKGYDYAWWNLHHALCRFDNVETRFFDYATEARELGCAAMSDRMVELVRKDRPDMLLCASWDAEARMLSEALSAIAGLTMRVVFAGSDGQVKENGENLSTPPADCLVVLSPAAMQRYREAGFSGKIIRSQWAFNPFTYRPPSPSRLLRGISFVGAMAPHRLLAVEALRKAGLTVDVFGAGWPDDVYLSFCDMVRVWAETRVNLSLEDLQAGNRSLRRRHFEIPGCGGFLLTTPADGIEEFYAPGEEIAVASDLGELVDKARYYLAHETERAAIAKAGHARTLAEHTWTSRLAHIFSEVGVKPEPKGGSLEKPALPGNRAARRSHKQSPGGKASRPLPDRSVSVCIQAYNHLNYTKLCVESVLHYTRGPYELILSDNGSHDGTYDYFRHVQKIHPNTRIVKNFGNRLVEATNNYVCSVASGAYLALLSSDVMVHENWLENLIDHIERSPDIGMVGPRSNSISGPQMAAAPYDSLNEYFTFAEELSRKNKGGYFETDRMVGMACLTKRAIYERVGGTDPELPTNGRDGGYGFSDDDLSLRFRLAGYRLIVANDVFMHHFGSVSVIADQPDVFGAPQNLNLEKFRRKVASTPGIRRQADGTLLITPSKLTDRIDVPERCRIRTPRACILYPQGCEEEGVTGRDLLDSLPWFPLSLETVSPDGLINALAHEARLAEYDFVAFAPDPREVSIKAIVGLLDRGIHFPDVALLFPGNTEEDSSDVATPIVEVCDPSIFVANMSLVRPHLKTLIKFGDAREAFRFLQRRLRGDGYLIATTGSAAAGKGAVALAESVFALPERLIEQNRLAEAKEICLRDIEIDPSFAQSLYQLAQIAVAENRRPEAVAFLNRILSFDADHLPAYLMLARISLGSGDLEGAERYIGQARFRQPKHPDVARAVNELMEEKGRVREASPKEVPSESRPEAPGPPAGIPTEKEVAKTLHAQAIVLQGMGRTELAIRQIELALELDQDNPEFFNDIGVLHHRTGDTKKALACLRKADALQPCNPETLKNLGWALLGEGADDEAVDTYIKVADIAPDDVEVLSILGNLSLRYGQEESARRFFERVLAIDPANPSAGAYMQSRQCAQAG